MDPTTWEDKKNQGESRFPAQNENGIDVCNEDRDLLIHTDGTGFISEDLAMKCPSARYLRKKKPEASDVLVVKLLQKDTRLDVAGELGRPCPSGT